MFPSSFLTCPQKNRLVEKAIGLEGFGQIESVWSHGNMLHAAPIKETVSRDFLLPVSGDSVPLKGGAMIHARIAE